MFKEDITQYCHMCEEWAEKYEKLKNKFSEYSLKSSFVISFQDAFLDKYKQCIAEIKEYCIDMKKDHYWGMRMMRFANEILQKISECEVKNEGN